MGKLKSTHKILRAGLARILCLFHIGKYANYNTKLL